MPPIVGNPPGGFKSDAASDRFQLELSIESAAPLIAQPG